MFPCKKLRTSMPGEAIDAICLDVSWQSEQKTSPMTATGTPRPAPQFFSQTQTFSTKKSRGNTPRDGPPPKPPIKSAPPVSRVFHHKSLTRAQAVSFKGSDSSFDSPRYNEESRDLYFNQCFEIESKIGIGSFGEVFKVRSKDDGKYYAVKRSREHFRGETDRKRKLEEVAKHEKLPPHPNCVGFVKAWEERQHLYIQTELCRTSLENFAERNHNIPEKIIWNYLVDLLMAVKHLHDHELIHLDIKPENIFISDAGICKLGDFGLVLDLSSQDISEAQEGDNKYMAPELLTGKFGKPADIFSLGITIMELASDLDLPRNGEPWQQLRSGNLPEEFLLGISADLITAIRWMMEPDWERRRKVDDILGDPLLKEIWKSRKREQNCRNMIQSSASQRLSTPVRENGPCLSIDWDHSFSDDEVFDEGINLHNNSLGQPLDCSTSSEDTSLSRDADGFVLPSLPPRKAMTTPAIRHRPSRRYTPEASSPVMNKSAGPYYSSSPVSPATSRRYTHNESITPNSSFHERLTFEPDDDVEPDLPSESRSDKFEGSRLQKNLFGMEPKNLFEVFMDADNNNEDEED